MSAERLQKLMSQAGISSRREAEEYITQGRVTVNGRIAVLGDRADLSTDDVRVDGSRLKIAEERVYIALYKPMHVVTANMPNARDKKRTVRELIPIGGHIFPVGRLDADSEGLVLMTDDGELAEKLTHPRFEHPKTYEVTVHGNMPDAQIEKWKRGVTLDDGPTSPADVRVIERNNDYTQLRVVMHEGRKRQIRRTASILGNNVAKLVRTKIGSLTLEDLKPGDWRFLTDQEIATLQELAGTPRKRSRRPSYGRAPTPIRERGSDDGQNSQRSYTDRPRRPSTGRPGGYAGRSDSRPPRRDDRRPYDRDRRDGPPASGRDDRPDRPQFERSAEGDRRPYNRDGFNSDNRGSAATGDRPRRPSTGRPGGYAGRSDSRPPRRDDRRPYDRDRRDGPPVAGRDDRPDRPRFERSAEGDRRPYNRDGFNSDNRGSAATGDRPRRPSTGRPGGYAGRSDSRPPRRDDRRPYDRDRRDGPPVAGRDDRPDRPRFEQSAEGDRRPYNRDGFNSDNRGSAATGDRPRRPSTGRPGGYAGRSDSRPPRRDDRRPYDRDRRDGPPVAGRDDRPDRPRFEQSAEGDRRPYNRDSAPGDRSRRPSAARPPSRGGILRSGPRPSRGGGSSSRYKRSRPDGPSSSPSDRPRRPRRDHDK